MSRQPPAARVRPRSRLSKTRSRFARQTSSLFFSFDLRAGQYQRHLPAAQQAEKNARTLIAGDAGVKDGFAQRPAKGPS